MKFSIITPTYNSEKFILECLESIHNQVGEFDIEHIIVDGGSTDKTIEITKSFMKRKGVNIKVLVGKDKNMYDAINKGIAQITGDIWAVLNSDDQYANNNILEKIIKTFESYPDVEVVFGQMNVVDRNGKFVKRSFIPKFTIAELVNAEKCLFIPQPATFLKKSVIGSVGLFDDRYNIASDYDYMIRIILKCKYKSINKVVTLFRRHDLSYSVQANEQNDESFLISENYRSKLDIKEKNTKQVLAKYMIYNFRPINYKFILKKYFLDKFDKFLNKIED